MLNIWPSPIKIKYRWFTLGQNLAAKVGIKSANGDLGPYRAKKGALYEDGKKVYWACYCYWFYVIKKKKSKGLPLFLLKKMRQIMISEGKIEFEPKIEDDCVVVVKRKSIDFTKNIQFEICKRLL